MMAADYRHIGGRENRLGRHYSRFSPFWPTPALSGQSLALRKLCDAGSNRRSQAKPRVAMRKPFSVRSLEQLGRVRLSSSFFMRDFLHSEIADLHGIPNIPDDPDLAIAAGRCLCEELLEPLQVAFGRLAIRSASRAPAVNAFGNA